MESDHFTDATSKQIISHWNNHNSVTIYKVWAIFVALIPIRQSYRESYIKRNLQECDSENTVAVQMQIPVNFKSTEPNITKECIITDAFGTGGDDEFLLTLKKEACNNSYVSSKHQRRLLSNHLSFLSFELILKAWCRRNLSHICC